MKSLSVLAATLGVAWASGCGSPPDGPPEATKATTGDRPALSDEEQAARMDRASCEMLLAKVNKKRDEENRKTAGGTNPRFIPASLRLAPVASNPKLEAVAREWGRAEAEGPSPKWDVTQKLREAGYRARVAGLVVVPSITPTPDAFAGTLAKKPESFGDQDRRGTLFGEFTEVGIALVRRKDTKGGNVNFVWSLVFARPWPEVVPESLAADLVSAWNRKRAEDKKPPLATDPALESLARKGARMLALKGLTDRKLPRDRQLSDDQYRESDRRFGQTQEIFVSGPTTADEAIRSGLKVPGPDRKFGEVTHAAVAVSVADDGRPYWFALFARPTAR